MAPRGSTTSFVEQHIRWYDHNYFRGYVFATCRRGQKHTKYFSAKAIGRLAALAQARSYRDWLLPQLPPPTRLKHRNSANVSGVIGVRLSREGTRQGRVIERYAAVWPIKGGGEGKATFSVAKFGKREAFRRAVTAREKGVAEFESSESYRDYPERSRSSVRAPVKTAINAGSKPTVPAAFLRDRHVSRVDRNYFHGWCVAIKRAGSRVEKLFSDKPGGPAASHQRAVAYRDRLLKQLPPPTKIKRRYVRNTTGVIGVSLQKERTRAGNWIWRYRAQWPGLDGRWHGATFSVAKYGHSEAKRRAMEARRRGLEELLGSS